jgi:hypothetical protein
MLLWPIWCATKNWIERDQEENGYDNDADIGIVKPFGAKDLYNVPIEQWTI